MRLIHEGVSIEFDEGCLRMLSEQRQIGWLSKENGGQLFARFTPEGIRVSLATVTKGKSRRTRYGFFPDRNAERMEVAALFQNDYHYVGDWHTHPEDSPNPSDTDKREMMEIFRNSKHELTFMLLVVVGRVAFPAGLFVGAVTSHRVQRISIE